MYHGSDLSQYGVINESDLSQYGVINGSDLNPAGVYHGSDLNPAGNLASSQESGLNHGFSLVESQESWPLIGREGPFKMIKGGTLRILINYHPLIQLAGSTNQI